MSEYLVIINAENDRSLSPAEEQYCITEYGKWAEKLGEKLVTARRLDLSPGKLLPSKRNPVTDGPFVEAKELIVGFILLNATSVEEATQIADTCPLGEYFRFFIKPVKD